MSLETWLELYVAILLTSWCIFDVRTTLKKKRNPKSKKLVNLHDVKKRWGNL